MRLYISVLAKALATYPFLNAGPWAMNVAYKVEIKNKV